MGSINRNDLCHCGSGKKYKKCCLAKDEESARSKKKEEGSTALPEKSTQNHAKKPFRESAKPRNIDPIKDIDFDDPDFYDPDMDEVCTDESCFEDEDIDQFDSVIDDSDGNDPEPEDTLEDDDSGKHIRYPRPPDNHRELSEQENKIIDAWWDEIMPSYKAFDVEKMIEAMKRFETAHPELFSELGLEEEFLFELGGALATRKEWSRYTDILKELRNKYPEMYVRSFAYFDRDIIIDAVISGKEKEALQYLDFYKKYPDSSPDEVSSVADFLAFTDKHELLFELADICAIPMSVSPNVIRGDFLLDWLIFARFLPAIEASPDFESRFPAIVESIDALAIPDFELAPEEWRQALQAMVSTPRQWDVSELKKQSEIDDFYMNIIWNFMAYLHEAKHLGWVKARYISFLLYYYLLDNSGKKKSKDVFKLQEQTIEKYIVVNYKTFFWVDGVMAFGLLEAVRHFAEYLASHHVLGAGKVDETQEICRGLAKQCIETLDISDPIHRLPETSVQPVK